MFRFAELTHDEGKETYRYMSAAASQTIIDAIEDMISPLERLKIFSDIIFGGEDWEEYFFSGIRQYIPFSCVKSCGAGRLVRHGSGQCRRHDRHGDDAQEIHKDEGENGRS